MEPAHPAISVMRQCGLMDLAPSSFYYRPAGKDQLNLELMRRLDEDYGSRKLVVCLRKAGYAVNRKRVQGLMRRLGLEAIYQKPRLSAAGRGHKRYPYLLRGMTVERPVSMDGCGRVYDNIFVERFWRSVKYEEVYLHEYRSVAEARAHLGEYFRFYNDERPHEALGYRTPREVYYGSSATLAPAAEAVV